MFCKIVSIAVYGENGISITSVINCVVLRYVKYQDNTNPLLRYKQDIEQYKNLPKISH